MSIILDALRKSEAARRRNEAPALFDAMPTAAVSEHTRPNWPLWVGGGIGVVSLTLALWLTMRTGSHASTDADAGAERTARQVGVETAPAATTAMETVQNATETTHTVIAADASPSVPRDVVETPAPIPPPNITPNAASTPREIAAERTQQSAPQTTVAPPIDTPARVEPVSTDAFRSPQSDGPLALADLDADARKQLPPLKLSMHMWHDTPAQRFVILDGQRLREGDVLGDVVIERITRDGATLSWRGTTLKVDWR